MNNNGEKLNLEFGLGTIIVVSDNRKPAIKLESDIITKKYAGSGIGYILGDSNNNWHYVCSRSVRKFLFCNTEYYLETFKDKFTKEDIKNIFIIDDHPFVLTTSNKLISKDKSLQLEGILKRVFIYEKDYVITLFVQGDNWTLRFINHKSEKIERGSLKSYNSNIKSPEEKLKVNYSSFYNKFTFKKDSEQLLEIYV